MWLAVIAGIVWAIWKISEMTKRDNQNRIDREEYMRKWRANDCKPLPRRVASVVVREFVNPNTAVVAKCPQPVSRVYDRSEYDMSGWLVEEFDRKQTLSNQYRKSPVVLPVWFIDKWVAQLTISPAEQLIIDELVRYDIRWEREVSFAAMPLTDKGANYRYDFLLVDHGIVLEYDSVMWHKDPQRLTIDGIKNQFCIDNGIEVMRYNNKHYYNMGLAIKELLQRLGVRQVTTC